MKDANVSSNTVQEIRGEVSLPGIAFRKSQIEQDHNPCDNEIWVCLLFTPAGHFLFTLKREKFEYFGKDVQNLIGI